MSNDDLKKITTIKQYLLDPPATFKLYDYALVYVEDAIKVLENYSGAKNVMEHLQGLLYRLQNKSIPQEELRNTLKQAGIEISKLTGK